MLVLQQDKDLSNKERHPQQDKDPNNNQQPNNNRPQIAPNLMPLPLLHKRNLHLRVLLLLRNHSNRQRLLRRDLSSKGREPVLRREDLSRGKRLRVKSNKVDREDRVLRPKLLLNLQHNPLHNLRLQNPLRSRRRRHLRVLVVEEVLVEVRGAVGERNLLLVGVVPVEVLVVEAVRNLPVVLLEEVVDALGN